MNKNDFYDKVVTLLQERGISQAPDQLTVFGRQEEGKTVQEVAFEFVADWDVD